MDETTLNDIYTLAYQAIGLAKETHNPLKLYKGSPYAPAPHSNCLDFIEYFGKTQGGIFSYILEKGKTLAMYDHKFNPRLSTEKAFEMYLKYFGHAQEDELNCLKRLQERKHYLGFYRGGSSGGEDEALTFAALHFQTENIPATPDDVMIFTGGFKGAVLAACGAIMTKRYRDQVTHLGGRILVPEGYYQSLRLIPSIFNGKIDCFTNFSANTIKSWIETYSAKTPLIIYVPLINNENGMVLTQDDAHKIAKVILEYNKQHPDKPVLVIADDVYVGSYLEKNIKPMSIASVTGEMLGDITLGRMYDWAVSIVTSSKTFTLPTARISFACSGNSLLRKNMLQYRSVFSQGRAPQIDELLSIAAISLTPLSWIDHWNDEVHKNLNYAEAGLEKLNQRVGFKAFTFKQPQGGWYLPLRLSRKLFPKEVGSSVEACYILATYGQDSESGIAVLPGEIFGYQIKPESECFSFRVNLAIDPARLKSFLNRLHEFYLVTEDKELFKQLSHRRLTHLHEQIPELLPTLKSQDF